MSTVGNLVQYMDEIAPFSLQESYDNAQLITGQMEQEITGVLCALDATQEVVKEAIELGCNVVLAHHPIVFTGLKKLTGDNYIERTIIHAIKNDIAILAVHTNLDSIHPGGVNSRFAEILGLTDCQPLMPKEHPVDENLQAGLGLVGFLAKAQSTPEFLKHVKESMGLKVLKHTRATTDEIHKVAICGGSGSFLLDHAILSEADAFITSDYKYHQFFDANGKLMILDIGHYESERHTIKLLQEKIRDKYLTFAAHCTKVNTNPVDYYI